MNKLEEELKAIQTTKSMLKWKLEMETDKETISELEHKILELNVDENKVLTEIKRRGY